MEQQAGVAHWISSCWSTLIGCGVREGHSPTGPPYASSSPFLVNIVNDGNNLNVNNTNNLNNTNNQNIFTLNLSKENIYINPDPWSATSCSSISQLISHHNLQPGTLIGLRTSTQHCFQELFCNPMTGCADTDTNLEKAEVCLECVLDPLAAPLKFLIDRMMPDEHGFLQFHSQGNILVGRYHGPVRQVIGSYPSHFAGAWELISFSRKRRYAIKVGWDKYQYMSWHGRPAFPWDKNSEAVFQIFLFSPTAELTDFSQKMQGPRDVTGTPHLHPAAAEALPCLWEWGCQHATRVG